MSMARKPKFDRQQALKGLLLLALLANVSWQPAMKSLDLASTETKSGTSAPAAAPAPEPEAAPQDPIGGNAKAATGQRADQASTLKVCDQRVMLTYSEVKTDKGYRTNVTVKPQLGGGFKPFNYKNIEGGLAQTYDDAGAKADIEAKLTGIIRNRIGGTCAFQTSVSAQVAAEIPQASPQDKEKVARGMRECRLDARGEVLSESKRMVCELRRLSEIDCNNDRMSGKARATAEIDRRVKSIRAHVKNRLMSRDEDKVEEGEDTLSEVQDTLKDLAVECELDPTKMSRMASGLESLRAGGETYRRSVEYDETVKAAKEELRQQYMEVDQMARANPRDPVVQMQAQQLRSELQNRYNQLKMDIITNVNPFYTTLLNAQRTGLMPLSEFSQFAQPYQILGRDLNSLSNPQLLMYDNYGGINPNMGGIGGYGGQPQMQPGNFVQYRQGLANGYNGITPGVTNGISNTNPIFNNNTMYNPQLFNQNSIRNLNSPPLMNGGSSQARLGAGNRF